MRPASSRIENDWFGGALPNNIDLDDEAVIETSYTLAMFDSVRRPGLTIGRGTGIYVGGCIITGREGSVRIGQYCCLNAANIIASGEVIIGDHVLLGWGSVLTDTVCTSTHTVAGRRRLLEGTALDLGRGMPTLGPPRPVVLEDNVWVGFGAVIGPGVTVGRDSVVGARSVVTEDVPRNTVVVGDPARVVSRW